MVHSRVSPVRVPVAIAAALLVASGCAGRAAEPGVAPSAAIAAQLRHRDSVVLELTALVESLRIRLDTVTSRSDSLRESTLELREAIRVRDEQLRAARLELQRLKEIDLKAPRKPPAR
jgi:hypothetical protein